MNKKFPVSTLRRARADRGLSLDELGLRASVERTKLGRAERGYANLTKEELDRISRALGVESSALLADGSARRIRSLRRPR